MYEYESDEDEVEEEKTDEATVAQEQVCSFKRNIYKNRQKYFV
jgi:hypothetical protein